MHIVAAQVVATFIVGLPFLVQGVASAVAAWAGGMLMVVGTALLGVRVFTAPPSAGREALRRFAMGMLLKWVIALGGFYLILVRFRLPPLPALTGFGATLLVNFLALKFER